MSSIAAWNVCFKCFKCSQNFQKAQKAEAAAKKKPDWSKSKDEKKVAEAEA